MVITFSGYHSKWSRFTELGEDCNNTNYAINCGITRRQQRKSCGILAIILCCICRNLRDWAQGWGSGFSEEFLVNCIFSASYIDIHIHIYIQKPAWSWLKSWVLRKVVTLKKRVCCFKADRESTEGAFVYNRLGSDIEAG